MPDKEGIEDKTGTNLVNLRRTIYLTIMNALNYEEAVHKLLKITLQEGEEVRTHLSDMVDSLLISFFDQIELVNMIIECCSQERSYSSFYGLVGERFSRLNRVWTDAFEEAFRTYYSTIHRYETNRLRNIARFFGHMFASDAISWTCFECVKMNEDDTTSSSRIFIKILMTEMMESMGLATLKERFQDPEVKHACGGMFPMDVPKNTRFSINYFTSINLGILTEDMREWLKVRFSLYALLLFAPADLLCTIERTKTYHGATPCHARSRIIVLRFFRLGFRLGFRFFRFRLRFRFLLSLELRI